MTFLQLARELLVGFAAFAGVMDDSTKPAPSPYSSGVILARALGAADQDPDRDSLLVAIATTFARAGRVHQALRIANRIPRESYRDAAVWRIAAVQARDGDVGAAIRTADALRGRARGLAITLIAWQQARSGDARGGLQTIRAELGDGPESADALLRLAQAQAAAGDDLGASRTYDSIPIPLDKARAQRSLARARLKAGDIPGALQAAEETRRILQTRAAQDTRQDVRRPLDPDTFRTGLLGEIAGKQAETGDFEGAARTADSITSPYSRACTIAKIAAIRARGGDRDGAKVMIARAREAADKIRHQGSVWTEIAVAQLAAGETETARETFLRALGTVGAVMNQVLVVDAQARAGDAEGALQTAKVIPSKAIQEKALRCIARRLAEAGGIPKAIAIADKISAPEVQALALQQISEAQAKAGDQVGALSTILRIRHINGRLQGDALRSVAHDWARLGDIKGALRWAEDRGTPETKARALLGVAEGMLPALSMPSLQGESL